MCHIHATDKDDFILIKKQLTSLNFKWISHKAQDEIPKKLVLKGIDKSYTDTEVLDDLKQQYEHVSGVKQMTALKDGKHVPIGVYLVYFEWNTKLSIPKKVIKYCCHHKIKWDYFRSNDKSRKVRQCFRCQGFGHHSSECNLDSRCVKCTSKHERGQCPKVRGVHDPMCCNCGGKHPANYQGCSKIKEYVNNRKKPSDNLNNRPAQHPNRGTKTPQVKRKLSYNSVVKGNLTVNDNRRPKEVSVGGAVPGRSQHGQHSRGPSGVSIDAGCTSGGGRFGESFSFITGEIDSLFGIPLDQLMSTVNDFVPQYRQCSNDTQRKLMLLDFLCKISP